MRNSIAPYLPIGIKLASIRSKISADEIYFPGFVFYKLLSRRLRAKTVFDSQPFIAVGSINFSEGAAKAAKFSIERVSKSQKNKFRSNKHSGQPKHSLCLKINVMRLFCHCPVIALAQCACLTGNSQNTVILLRKNFSLTL
jgi:hypothetical protein